MLDYMIALMDNANYFCDAAKASHAVLLWSMEQGEIKHYGEVDKIDRVRRANAQRHLYPSQGSNYAKKNAKNVNKSMP